MMEALAGIDPQQISYWATFAQTVIAFITLAAAAYTAIIINRTLKLGRRDQEAQIFLELSKKYNEI